jgi:hypothetical protein
LEETTVVFAPVAGQGSNKPPKKIGAGEALC